MRFFGVISAAMMAAGLTSCTGTTTKANAEENVEACVKAAERRDESAVSLCDTALAISGLSDDDQARALAARAAAFGSKRDYDPAIADFTKSITLRPDASTYYRRAGVYIAKGEFAAAVDDLDRAIRLTPDDARFYNDRGWVRMMQGETTPALSDLSRAIALAPGLARIYENRAIYHFIQGDYSTAITDLEHSRELLPQNPFTHIWLYIATRRNHGDAAEVLRKSAGASDAWPGVFLRHIQGKASELDVHAAVRSGPYGAVSADRDCYSQVIFGELALLDQWKDTAAAHFRNASRICPRGQADRIIAEAELKRM